MNVNHRLLRRNFIKGLLFELRVVWPILSVLLMLVVALGIIVGIREGWPVGQSLYFSFISALTIGYGDIAPKTGLARALAVVIGLCGLLLTAIVAAMAVKALTSARGDR